MARQRKDLFVEKIEMKSVNDGNLTVSDQLGMVLVYYLKNGDSYLHIGVNAFAIIGMVYFRF
jgi:predicted AAA+ superfamily ATPase